MVLIVSFLHGRFFFFFFTFAGLLIYVFGSTKIKIIQNEEPKVHHVHADLKRPTFAQEIYQFHQSWSNLWKKGEVEKEKGTEGGGYL